MVGGERSQPFEKPGDRWNHTHVPRQRRDDDGCDTPSVAAQQFGDRVQVVVARDQGVGGDRFRHAWAVWNAQRGGARARLHEERIPMPVIAAGELDDPVATRRSTRQPQGAHRGLGS